MLQLASIGYVRQNHKKANIDILYKTIFFDFWELPKPCNFQILIC
jgi:hypothetical protein